MESWAGGLLTAANRLDGAAGTPAGFEPRADALSAPRTVSAYERWGKPIFDRATGLALSLLTLPAILLLALYVLIRLGRPVLYREERVGRNGKVFRMNRFRTMRLGTNANESSAEFERRVLPAGRFLRRWSLDELPQCWNILLGDMSLVGPRPERPAIVERYQPWQHQRHQVKPGATGLWQVTARGDGRYMHEHVEVDLRYIARLSFLYDLRILSRTVGVVLRRPERPSVIPGIGDTMALPKRTWRETGYLLFKRLGDITGSAVLLLFLSPVMLVTAVAIRVDSPGPALFRQLRVGHHGYLFRVVKFRTMELDALEEPHRAHYASLAGSERTKPMRLEHDPRITRLGRFLRAWSVDELPNLWNVLKGDMSLVGPRPLVPYELDLYTAQDFRRLDAKPGITGMAQVLGRGHITMEDRIRYDLEYVDRRSVWFDVRMLLRTLATVVRTRGA